MKRSGVDSKEESLLAWCSILFSTVTYAACVSTLKPPRSFLFIWFPDLLSLLSSTVATASATNFVSEGSCNFRPSCYVFPLSPAQLSFAKQRRTKMFTALLAVMLVTVSPVVSANPSAGLTSLAPQLQKRIHGQSTIVHFPATTSWSSQPVTALSIVETPHVYSHEDMTCPAQCPWIPAVPLTIDAGVPHRWFVVEQGISDAASSSSKSASGVDVQPSGGSHEQCTNGSSIALDNLTSWINGHHAQNGVVSDVDFQSEILQPILVTNSVLHHPRLTFIKDQSKSSTNATEFQKLTNTVTVLRFLVGWIGVGALCYAVGSLSLSSFATGSVKRCSFVVEITCDHAVAGSSSLQQSDSFLSKEWRDKQKGTRLMPLMRKYAKHSLLAIASGPFLLRMRDLCVSALDVVVAFILWFGNLCREVRQGRQKGKPAGEGDDLLC